MTHDQLTKDEKSLLLFFECAYVDWAGKYNPLHMNDEDREIAKRWNETGFVKSGRVRMKDIGTDGRSYYAFLSDEAFAAAHEERRARAKRMQDNRKWQTTEEKLTKD